MKLYRANKLEYFLFKSVDSPRSETLCGWIRNAAQLPGNDDEQAATFVPSSAPLALANLSAISHAIHKVLPRLLSSSQRIALERAMQHWVEKLMTGENTVELAALRTGAASAADPQDILALEVTQRLHFIKEVAISDELLGTLEARSERLRLSIPLGQEPEILQELSRSHSVGRFRGKIVFVEKRINIGWVAEGVEAVETFLRIDSLAARLAERPKPPTFCALNLLGYFSDRRDKEYGFVYEWPCEIGATWDDRYRPRTLNELIVDTETDDVSFGPSLTERFNIARKMAMCVKTFHLFGWVHKSINSHNVVLFPSVPAGRQSDTVQEDRLFLVGFEYSRKDGRLHGTEPVTKIGDYDIYRHPDVTGFERRSDTASKPNVFERKHDLYALGLLLAEVGTWSRLELLQSSYYAASLHEADASYGMGSTQHIPTPHEFRAWVTKNGKGSIEALLKFSNGDKYVEATMACLREEVEGGEDYFPSMYERVLAPLGSCDA